MQGPLFDALDGHRPQIAEDAFIAPATVVVGRVRIDARSSVWYGSVLRGDDEDIFIGEYTNVQDFSMMHADPGYPAVLGKKVTIGHRAIVHGAAVEDDVLIGMGAILLNGARLGSVPENSLVAGLPAKVIREVRDSDREMIRHAFEGYVRKSDVHRGIEPLGAWEVRG
jgi:carbonic anhydrase/acetyltransferase-like protein (isoleucine patch superfamily)